MGRRTIATWSRSDTARHYREVTCSPNNVNNYLPFVMAFFWIHMMLSGTGFMIEVVSVVLSDVWGTPSYAEVVTYARAGETAQ